MTNTQNDPVNHPSHYTQYPVEVIELTRHMNFGRGNAVKYIARAGYKGGPEKELQDLEKAAWYIADEINEAKKKLAKKEASNSTGGSWDAADFHKQEEAEVVHPAVLVSLSNPASLGSVG